MKQQDKTGQSMPDKEPAKAPAEPKTKLDQGLAETFPASDPISVSTTKITPEEAKRKQR